jgi:methionyl-tRNA formyltransferase
MRIVFFGAGAFGLPTLERLAADHELIAVVSQPDKPAGRKRALTPTPVAGWALEYDVPLFREQDVNTPAFIARVADLQPDASVVIAFGQKLCPELIDAMGRLAINLHASLLPKYRGAAPIHWAMIHGETTTGVSVIGLAQRMDAGEIYATASTDIDPQETAGELHDRLAELGPDAVAKVLDDLAAGTLSPVTQGEDAATRAPKFTKADGTVAFDQPASQVRARVHGLTPWPGCRVFWRSAHYGNKQTLLLRRVRDHPDADPGTCVPGTLLDDLTVACAAGTLELLEVQTPGGKPTDFYAFVKGHRLRQGDTLSPL